MLTIGELAAQAGTSAATLRTWEQRHGFPEPQRLPSGHRRYPATAAAEVRSVLERQRAGLSLQAAIAATRADRADTHIDTSVFAAAAAASRRPPTRLSRRAMLAFSRAIEDACAAAGGSTVLVGCFQREDVYRACEPRWLELARGAHACVAVADFADVGGSGVTVEVPITSASPLHREWAVAVGAPRLAACLTGWEWPDGDRFEALWSTDPDVVRAVIDRTLAVARTTAPERMAGLDGFVDLPAASDVDAAMRVFDRVVERLDR